MSRKNRNNQNPGLDYSNEPISKMGLEGLRVQKLTFKTAKQKVAYQTIQDNDVTFLIGSAGTGKTFIPVQYSAEGLKNGEFDGVILTRPAVEAGETMGFLPGTVEEKLAPYMSPLMDCYSDVTTPDTAEALFEEGIIQFIPINFMRGRTFKNKLIIVDEAQNATKEQLKLVLTRVGEGSKIIITADDRQIDIPNNETCMNDLPLFRDVEGIGYVKFSDKDVMRSKVVKLVLSCYDVKVAKKPEA